MTDTIPDPVAFNYEEKLGDAETGSGDLKDKKDGSVEAVSEIDDEAQLRETEALEARLASGEADDAEYKVKTAHDVAVKVLSTRCVRSLSLSVGGSFSLAGTTWIFQS
jgi:hypothetical protein